MVFARNAVEALNRHALNRNVVLPDKLRKFLCQFVVLTNFHQNFIDLFAKFNGFDYGACAENVIVGVPVLILLLHLRNCL